MLKLSTSDAGSTPKTYLLLGSPIRHASNFTISPLESKTGLSLLPTTQDSIKDLLKNP